MELTSEPPPAGFLPAGGGFVVDVGDRVAQHRDRPHVHEPVVEAEDLAVDPHPRRVTPATHGQPWPRHAQPDRVVDVQGLPDGQVEDLADLWHTARGNAHRSPVRTARVSASGRSHWLYTAPSSR